MRRIAAVVPVAVLGALPFTDVYGHAGLLERLLHLAATMLTVLAVALLLTPIVRRLGNQARAGATSIAASVCLAYTSLR